MGIPLYFRHVIQDYQNNLLLNPKNITNCDRIFFDFNCIIHGCAAKINEGKNMDDLFRQIIRDSIAYMNDIVQRIRPTSLVFIAVDGPCPFSKMVQQRKRRFLSTWKNDQGNDRVVKAWDSNCVTPGTLFMDSLNASLKEYVDECMKNNEKQDSGYRVCVSDSTEFGEGEHKIFRYLRQHPGRESKTDLIYGLDADLILLSLCALNRRTIDGYNIGLLREVPEFNLHKAHGFDADSSFLILDIKKLATTIVTQHGHGIVSESLSARTFLNDYVMLCTFFGNDFLPTLSFLKVGTDNVTRLMSTYKECIDRELGTLLDAEFDLNIGFLRMFLSILAKDEDLEWNRMLKHYDEKKAFVPRYIEQQGFKKKKQYEMERFPLFHREWNDTFLINPAQKGWRMNYYYHYFGHSPDIGRTVHHACQEYMKGLQFVCDYYWKQTPCLHWHYPYFYAPTLLDMCNFTAFFDKSEIEMSSKHNTSFVDMLKNNKYLQLMCVLPPQSLHLIPEKKCRDLVEKIEYGCVHFYPERFRLSTFLKDFLWECNPIIPMIKINYVQKQLELQNAV